MIPTIRVLMTTWLPPDAARERLAAAQKAFTSWAHNLVYEGSLGLFIADDGSNPALIDLVEKPSPIHWKLGTIKTSQARRGVGASFNNALNALNEHEPDSLVLYLVDDWELLQPFDLTPWARLFTEDQTIGMVRLGLPHPWLTGTIEHGTVADWYMRINRHHFVYGFRPALYHRRFFDAYGPFDEGVNSYDCERLYNERFCVTEGPDVVLALPHPWQHIESVELAGVTP